HPASPRLLLHRPPPPPPPPPFLHDALPIFLLDAEGLPLVDDEGNPIPDPAYFETPPSIVRGNARNSSFFTRFSNGRHSGFLNDSELKLLREWIDIGARHYQNPFDSADPTQE